MSSRTDLIKTGFRHRWVLHSSGWPQSSQGCVRSCIQDAAYIGQLGLAAFITRVPRNRKPARRDRESSKPREPWTCGRHKVLPINSLGSDAALIAVSMQSSKHFKPVFLYSISRQSRSRLAGPADKLEHRTKSGSPRNSVEPRNQATQSGSLTLGLSPVLG
jgi:hypothetical protein